MSVKTYYQHILDVLIKHFRFTYGSLEEHYNHIFRDQAVGAKGKPRTIQADSIESAHKKPTRGNKPTGISSSDFYDWVILDQLKTDEQLTNFAARLYEALTEANAFPVEWESQIAQINGAGPVDEPTFARFIVYLLDHNKDPRKRLSAAAVTAGESPALSFSRQFFTEGANTVLKADDATFAAACANLSRVFRDVMSIRVSNDAPAIDLTAENAIAALKDWIVGQLAGSDHREILKMKGPLGSYKNRLIQLLYLALEREADTYVPLYIDLAAYERAAEGKPEIDETHFLQKFKLDAQRAEAIFAQNPGKKPLLLLDGIRDFTCKNEAFYYGINKYIRQKNWYLITCMDSSFTVNPQNKFDIHPLVSTNYDAYLRIRSMNLYQKEESIAFIRNCVEVFAVPLPSDVTPEKIYEALARLNFMALDAYWLTFLLRSYLGDIMSPDSTLAGLYNALSLRFLGSHNEVEAAAKFAYDFEYSEGCFESVNPYADSLWRFIRKHRSVLDFLIAKEYVRRVSKLTLYENNHDHNRKELKIFEMVLQEYISRFIYGLLRGNEDYEHQIMCIVHNHYYDLSPIGKSELSFRMTGLQNKSRKTQCLDKIKQYCQEAIEQYDVINDSNIKEKKDMAFLIRSLNINLIYADDPEAFTYYANMLLSDKLACSINRGFHLEFHGDKPYIPNKSLLEFEDDISKGFKAFSRNCMILDRRIARRDKAVYAAAIEILSLCQLLQARMVSTDQPVLDIHPFAKKCQRYLGWILAKHQIRNNQKVSAYFHWMKDELTAFLAHDVRHNKAAVFNKFNEKNPAVESYPSPSDMSKPDYGSDHAFSCWLIGVLYLPNTSNLHGYSKDDVLQMLLMHDLGKKDFSVEEVENIHRLDVVERERKTMQALLFSGTYPEGVDLSHYYDLWSAYSFGHGINFLIARDIDTIQSVYRFCTCYIQNPDQFTEPDVLFFLDDIDELETTIGKEIADTLILENPLFRETLAGYLS